MGVKKSDLIIALVIALMVVLVVFDNSPQFSPRQIIGADSVGSIKGTSSSASISSVTFTRDATWQSCVLSDISKMRIGYVVASDVPSPRKAHVNGDSVSEAISLQSASISQIQNALTKLRVSGGQPVRCLLTGVVVDSLTDSQIQSLENAGFTVESFGTTSAGSAEEIDGVPIQGGVSGA